MRAIEAKELQAFRDNRNHWKITPQALEEWALAQCAPSGQVSDPAHLLPTPAQALPMSEERAGLQDEKVKRQAAETALQAERETRQTAEAELRREREGRRTAELEAAELRGRLDAIEAERDRLHGIVQRLTDTQRQGRSWWPWGKSRNET